MTTVSATQARANLYDLIDKVAISGKSVGITKKGETRAVLINPDELSGMIATIETLSDPELMAQIKESEEDIKAGRVYDWEDIKKELGLGDVSGQTVKSRKKRA